MNALLNNLVGKVTSTYIVRGEIDAPGHSSLFANWVPKYEDPEKIVGDDVSEGARHQVMLVAENTGVAGVPYFVKDREGDGGPNVDVKALAGCEGYKCGRWW